LSGTWKMSVLKALIVHPDREVTLKLREFFAGEKRIKILGEAVSSNEALELLESISYDVFFLGIDLPNGVSGMELTQMLAQRKSRPHIVLIAPDQGHAYKAFELGVADYLIWPFEKGRLENTVERLLRYADMPHIVGKEGYNSQGLDRSRDDGTVHLPMADADEDSFLNALRQAWDVSPKKQLEIEKLPINQEGRLLLVPYNQIVFVEAYEDYSFVHTFKEKFLTSYRLKSLEERLNKHGFFRVHRKYLVNLEMVTEIASMPGSNFMLRTAGRTKIELPISRRRINDLKQILGL